MSDSYTKLFSSITASTIVGEPVATRWVWVTMLAMVKRDGCVYASVPGLARFANLSIAETETALARFLGPDPYSRTTDNEGRRIAVIDGGWRLLNFAKYANLRDPDERAEYRRQWDREHRGNRPNAASRTPDNPRQPPTTPDSPPTQSDNPDPTSSSTTTRPKDQKKKQPRPSAAALPDPPEWLDKEAWLAFVQMRQKKRAPLTDHAADLIFRELVKLADDPETRLEILNQSTRSSWTDVYPLKNGASNVRSGSESKTVLALNALDKARSVPRGMAGR